MSLRTGRRAVLTPDQTRQLRKLLALNGSRGTAQILGCGEPTLDGVLSGVAAPKTVARIAARLDELRGGT
jgi:hypothetical protein